MKETGRMEESLWKTIALGAFAIFAGIVRMLNRKVEDIKIKDLLINSLTALLSGMLIYLLTGDFSFFEKNEMFQGGLVGLAGYMAPETLNILQKEYKKRLTDRVKK